MIKKLKLLTASLLLSSLSQAQVVTTLAGSGSIGSADGVGSAASFKYPAGVCIGSLGNIYVTDYSNSTIRKITPGGTVTTFAGSGIPGSTNGTGIAASFSGPQGICADPSGNIYVADSDNNTIRKITPAGVVTTFAGSGTAGFANGYGTAASFNVPWGLCSDASGNIYVTDSGNMRIRKITPGGTVSTLAGNGFFGSSDGTGNQVSFGSPTGICIDASGDIYVVDPAKHNVRKIKPTGLTSTVAGLAGTAGSTDGTGTSARFDNPEGICMDMNGDFYISDYQNNKIRKMTSAGVVTSFAGSGVRASIDGIGIYAKFGAPQSICTDASGIFYVVDNITHKIRKIASCTTPAPNAPTNTTTAPIQFCAGNTTTLSATSTGTVSWHTAAVGGTLITTGNELITSNTLIAGTYTYYAEASTCNISATRTAITITVNPTPTITVNSGTICSGNSFTISPGGASTYTINGGAFVVNPATNSSYTVTGQSTDGCINTAVATVSVNSTVIPAILISTASNTICGSSAIFSSTITNGGSAPTYQWKKNGSNVGSNISTYSPTGLLNNDVIYCELTSNLGCASPTAVSSNSLAMTVSSFVMPAILISTTNNTICGSSATFSSTITNGGSTPTYQWKKNGSNVGSNISTYSPTGLLNNDVIYCELTSNLGCASPTAVTSNSITMTVSSSVIPTISISTPSSSICGSNAAFSSTITNGGSAPTYQWKKNGVTVGSNISTYSPTSLQNGDVISCRVTSNLSCASPTVVNSNSMTITVNPTPTVTISSSNTLICVGETASLTANGAATYSWSSGSTNSAIVINPTNTTTYTVTGTTAAGCSATGSFTQTVNLCTSIEQFNTTLFNVYPNPSNGVFTVYSSSEASITIVNVLGELVYTNKLDKGDHTIDLFEQPNGIYFMQIQTNSIKNQIRLLKIN